MSQHDEDDAKHDRQHRNGKPRQDLLRESEDMRNKLVRAVGRIDERTHDALDLRKQVGRHMKTLAVAAGLAIVGTAGTAAFVMYRLLTMGRRRAGRWRLGAGSGWRQPEAPPRAQRGIVAQVLRSLTITLATTLLARPLRRAASGGRR
jgi:hypothetical protein